MNSDEMDNKVKQYYLGQSMSDDAVSRLLQSAAAQPRKPRSPWLYWGPVAAAAAIVMIFSFKLGARYDHDALASEVATLVASRHESFTQFDRKAHCFTTAQATLNDLSFSLTPKAKRQLLEAYEIVGARYCQLKGQEAAHLQVRHRETGALCTLFVASLGGKLSELADEDEQLAADTHRVNLWADSGRLFALVD